VTLYKNDETFTNGTTRATRRRARVLSFSLYASPETSSASPHLERYTRTSPRSAIARVHPPAPTPPPSRAASTLVAVASNPTSPRLNGDFRDVTPFG